MPRTAELLGLGSGLIAQMAQLDYDDEEFAGRVALLAQDWLKVIEKNEEYAAIEALFLAMGCFVAGTNEMLKFVISQFAEAAGLAESDPIVQEWLSYCNSARISAQLIEAAQQTREMEEG